MTIMGASCRWRPPFGGSWWSKASGTVGWLLDEYCRDIARSCMLKAERGEMMRRAVILSFGSDSVVVQLYLGIVS